MTRDYVAFSLRLANFLVGKGFKIKNSGINLMYPQFKVFYFEDSIQLRDAVNEYNSQKVKNSSKSFRTI